MLCPGCRGDWSASCNQNGLAIGGGGGGGGVVLVVVVVVV